MKLGKRILGSDNDYYRFGAMKKTHFKMRAVSTRNFT
jgi:hypothetical protein